MYLLKIRAQKANYFIFFLNYNKIKFELYKQRSFYDKN